MLFEADDFFTNVEAQDFAFEIKTRGADALHEVLRQKPHQNVNSVQRILAACELVAAANGHPPLSAGWCAMLESWLLKSKFVPTPAILELACKQLALIIVRATTDSKLAIPKDKLPGLLARLQKPNRKIKWKPVSGDRPAFRALAKWLDTSQGEISDGPEFDRNGNARVVAVYVTVNAASKLINYPKVRELELWLNNRNDRKELSAAVKILLRGWQTTLETLAFDHVVDLTIRKTPPPYRTLVECQTELADMPALRTFSTTNMVFDDRALEHVCQNSSLEEISITNAQISKKALEILAECKTLHAAYIRRCPKVTPADKAKLEKRLPHASVITIFD